MIRELDLQTLWRELEEYNKELEKENKSLQEVWIKMAELKKEADKDAQEMMRRPELQFLPADSIVSLNVGGQLFETTVDILTRDPYSILAACCRVKPLFKTHTDGKTYYFDRDWWIFRHILSYLRSNILPNELETLKEMYKEASFYRLESLQRSIEEIPVSEISNMSPHYGTATSSQNLGMSGTFGRK
jgi:BTB/POZ domain